MDLPLLPVTLKLRTGTLLVVTLAALGPLVEGEEGEIGEASPGVVAVIVGFLGLLLSSVTCTTSLNFDTNK